MNTRKIFFTILGLLAFCQLNAQNHDTFHLAINAVQADSVIKAHADSVHFVIMDVRTSVEYSAGYIRDAVNYNYYGEGFGDTLANLDKNREYLVYCSSGGRSSGTFNMMKELGFANVYNMLGGVSGWRAAGFPLVSGGTGIETLEYHPYYVLLYPVPVTSASRFVMPDVTVPSVAVRVINFNGQVIDEFELMAGESRQLTSEKLVKGLYFYQVLLDGEVIQSGKFLKTGY